MTIKTRTGWTPERRAAQSAMMKARYVNDKETFLAANQPRSVTTEEFQPAGDSTMGAGATVTHTTTQLVTMWKKTNYGWGPVRIPAQNVQMCWANGYRSQCPECNDHCGENGEPCPARPALMYRVCPVQVCGKKFYDTPSDKAVPVESGDPNMIQDDAYGATTPEMRTKASLEEHLVWVHPAEAASMGIRRHATRLVEAS